MRRLVPGAAGAAIMYSAETGQAWYRNLYLCNDVWACPVCSSRITAARRDELAAALAAARQLNWTPVLVTLTVQHQRGDGLRSLLDGLLASVRSLKSVRGFKDLKGEYDWRGDIRNLEPTYGLNGWHPHCHFLVFMGRPLTQPQVSGLRDWLSRLWLHELEKKGRGGSMAHAVDVRVADADIAEYVAKFGHEPDGHWGAADELARGPVKRGHRDGLTPWQLLDLYECDTEELLLAAKPIVRSSKQAGALFVEYAEAFRGRSQLQWSQGLRSALGLDMAKTDDELPMDEPGPAVQVALIERETWKMLCSRQLHGDLLDICEQRGPAGLKEWLADLGIHHIDLSLYDMPARGSPRRKV